MRNIYCFFIMMIAFFLVNAEPAFSTIGGRADFSYSRNMSRGAETSTNFTQSYNFNLSKNVTRVLSFNGSLQYNIYEVNGQRSDSMHPMFYVNFAPPELEIYNVRFSYSRDESFPSLEQRITRSHAGISFELPETRWPSAAVSLNYSTIQNHETIGTVDAADKSFGFGTGYGFAFLDTSARLNYSYSHGINENKVEKVETTSPSHSLSASLARVFLENKVSTNLNVGHSIHQSEWESRGALTQFPYTVSGAGYAGYPGYPGYLGFSLIAEPELTDSDVLTAVSPAIDLDFTTGRNIGIGFPGPQKLSALWVYIVFINPLDDPPPNFGWQLYYSADNVAWTLWGAITPTYSPVAVNGVGNRWEFAFPELTYQYFKVVNTLAINTTASIFVTEIVARDTLSATPVMRVEQKSTSTSAGFGVLYTPNERLRVSYNAGYGTSTYDNTDSVSTSMNHGIGLQYLFIPKYLLTLAADYSISASETSTGSVTTSDGGSSRYGIGVNSSPLDTINLNLNYVHGDGESWGKKVSESDHINSGAYFVIYPGINLGMTASLGDAKNLAADATASSMVYNWNLSLTPWTFMTVGVSGGHTKSESEQAGIKATFSEDSFASSVSMRFSRNLYASASFTIEPVKNQSYALTWVPTIITGGKLQMNVRLALTESGAASDTTVGWGVNWSPLRFLTISLGQNEFGRGGVSAQSLFSIRWSIQLF